MLAKRQRAEQNRLREEQRRQEKLVQDRLKAEQTKQVEANRSVYARNSAAMKQRQDAAKQAIRLERQALTRERNAELGAYRARVKSLKQERTQEHVAREAPDSKQSVDLTTEANKAFGAPSEEQTQSGDNSKGPGDSPGKPKRTRKRKDASERTNRRHTKDQEQTKATDTEQAAKVIDSWEGKIAERLERRQDRDRDTDHER
jgi:hypothetical protein